MCGRFSQILGKDTIIKRYNLVAGLEPTVSYNIAPRTKVSVITQESPKYLSMMQWSLVPWWSKTKEFNYDYINVRADKILSSKTTTELISTKRCVVPVSGFYEWKKIGNRKIPFYFSMKSEESFGIAGIYSIWELEEEPLYSFALITTDANDTVGLIHDRMPAIILPGNENKWLQEGLSIDTIQSFLSPVQSKYLEINEVSSRVNSIKNDSADLIMPVQSSVLEKIMNKDNSDKMQSSLDDFF